MKKINSYKFRIYPTPEQEIELFKTIGAARKTYNLILGEYQELYDSCKSGKLDKKEHSKKRRSLNPSFFSNQEEYAYLKEVDSTALKYAKRQVDRAYSNFFAGRAGFPNFKSKNRSKWSYTRCRAGKGVKNLRLEKGGKLVLPKISGEVKTVVSQNPVGTLVSATITKTRSNKWFASLQYEHHTTVPVSPETIAEITNPIGIDMGIKDLAVTSAGEVFQNAKHAYRAKRKLANIDRSLARKRERAKRDGRKLENCKNYQKTKIARARAYEKVTNQREDLLHKISSALLESHDFVALEDLSSSDLMKDHKVAFAVVDASWYRFFTFLEYKAKSQGKVVFKIDRYYASTQICSNCEEKTGPKGFSGLKTREWTCTSCGSVHDRDVNAAINILKMALKEFDRWDNGATTL